MLILFKETKKMHAYRTCTKGINHPLSSSNPRQPQEQLQAVSELTSRELRSLPGFPRKTSQQSI